MSPFHHQAPATLGDGHRTAPAWHKQQAPLDIEGMCCMARNAVHIAVERAGDDAKDALTLRSARYNQAHGLPLSAAQEVAIAAAARKKAAALDDAVRSSFLAVQARLHDIAAVKEAALRGICADIGIPPLEPVFDIDPTINIINWEPKDPTKWAPRSFGWDEGREHA